jgi:2-polyprenyl-3-methyl-5-hydroxy-6-metoxy-1,4-benzoquinol methylase
MSNEKTDVQHWDAAWAKAPRARVPSSLDVGIRNHKVLLRKYVTPGAKVLEIGFAPGKMLLWVAKELTPQVSGLDYSTQGLLRARELFAAMKVPAELHCEDVFNNTLAKDQFDFVYSSGLIEHFDDPREIVRQHVSLVRPGGKALLLVPNYGGWLGRVQGYLDPANLAIHNTSIMNPQKMLELVPSDMAASARAFYTGRFTPWLLSLDKKVPRWFARPVSWGLNGLAHLQFVQIDALSPMVALEIVRK